MKIRIGLGYDKHKLISPGEFIILGNIKIPYKKKFIAHSDGDVLIHSIIDGIFGALGESDIGTHFPDTDSKYKDIDSLILLKETVKIMKEKGFHIENIDSTIIAEEPKLAPYIEMIKERLAPVLEVNKKLISIKAKTDEGTGDVGEKRAIKVFSIVLLKSKT